MSGNALLCDRRKAKKEETLHFTALKMLHCCRLQVLSRPRGVEIVLSSAHRKTLRPNMQLNLKFILITCHIYHDKMYDDYMKEN